MIKKILIVEATNFNQHSPVFNALKTMGYDCSFLNYRQGASYTSPVMRALLRRIKFLRFIKDRAIKKINKKLLKVTDGYKPDLVFVEEGENILPETISQIRRQGAIVINWFIDFMTHWHIARNIAPFYDYFFISDGYMLEKLNEIGLKNCFYLPFAVENEFKKSPFENRKNIYNISLVASYAPEIWTKREKLLSSISKFGLNIWGPKAWKKSSLNNFYRGEARGTKMFEIYRQSKIVIDIPWDSQPALGISLRPTEAMISGACLFMYDIRPDVERYFKRNEEYVPFLTNEELKTKIKYYLENDSEREKIATSGYRTTLQNHTYSSRMAEMLNIVNQDK